jgi:hypothetical protein
MQCQTAATLLNRIQVGAAPTSEPDEEAAVEDLLRRGLLMEVQDGDGNGTDIPELRRQMADIQEARASGGLDAEEAALLEAPLRTRILEAAERQARARAATEWGGRRLAVTYAGRTLLGNLLTRQDRVGALDLDEFSQQMTDLKSVLWTRADKAAQILKFLSPALAPVDEIHLRNAAVGLAVRPEAPVELAKSFAAVFRALGTTNLSAIKHPLLSELAVVSRGVMGPEAAMRAAQELVTLRNTVKGYLATHAQGDDVTAAAILFAMNEADRESAMRNAALIANGLMDRYGRTGPTMTPWVLVASMGLFEKFDVVGSLGWFITELSNRGVAYDQSSIAAAIMFASRQEGADELVRQFSRAYSYLTRFGPEGMVVPSAMVAVMPAGIEESLDDLRIACAQISANKLSLAGMENMSLGVKLLLQSAVLAGAGPAGPPEMRVGPSELKAFAPIGIAGMAIVLPTAMAALYVFHETTVQQQAVINSSFHPVHTHFIYG